MVVDPDAYRWSDGEWKGLTIAGQVLYEMHIGTFTREGTWAAAAEALPELKELGITCLEVMPVAEFPGRFGWGYDGVDLYAPYHLYGTPDDMRRFVDEAHRLGLGVILDVVYNHLGPDGAYHKAFSDGLLQPRAAQDRVGRRPELRRARTAARCASSSSATPATGSTSSTSTACGSTPPRRSSTTPRSTSCRPSADTPGEVAAGRAARSS